MTNPTPHPEVTAPRLGLKSGGDFGNLDFSMSWWAITEPFVMVEDCHKHDFDQFILVIKSIEEFWLSIVKLPPK
jgi:hypothetical protein